MKILAQTLSLKRKLWKKKHKRKYNNKIEYLKSKNKDFKRNL